MCHFCYQKVDEFFTTGQEILYKLNSQICRNCSGINNTGKDSHRDCKIPIHFNRNPMRKKHFWFREIQTRILDIFFNWHWKRSCRCYNWEENFWRVICRIRIVCCRAGHGTRRDEMGSTNDWPDRICATLSINQKGAAMEIVGKICINFDVGRLMPANARIVLLMPLFRTHLKGFYLIFW